MFLTRVAPSNTFDVLSENFNKAQLIFTVSGLILAILITKPMVQRKKLREKWYQ
jgi:ER membrane protein complex subunit 1